ncbi:hypothetical protein [Microbispora sp. NPDC046933]|uniref:hypothetical protein n=1 Tax=Microbispora sp. NPDC046933 TaxID=3155618 RepID=UPI0033FC6F0E
MTRPALFDLDNTLVDHDEAFRRWAGEFADGHGLDAEAVERLVALDGHGYLPRETLWTSSAAPREVRDGLTRLRTAGRRVAIGILLSDAEGR